MTRHAGISACLIPIRAGIALFHAIMSLSSRESLLEDSRAAFTAAFVDRDAPGLPDIPRRHVVLGLKDCACFSSDRRNGTCRNNGCAPSPKHQMTCYWSCCDAEGSLVAEMPENLI